MTMAQDLKQAQQAAAAQLDATGIPQTFGNDQVALRAAGNGAALVDRSHWGLLQVAGADRLRFLHNQTTNTFQQRIPGEGCDTVFVTSTARTLDLVTAYITSATVLLLTSPGQDQPLFDWMDRYIFPMDKVEVTNLSPETAIFSLVGPESWAILGGLGIEATAAAINSHHLGQIHNLPVRVANGSGLTIPGATLIVPRESAAPVWIALIEAGVVPAGEAVWQQLRIQQGRPMPGAELTENYNPLEAGLWQTISFDKGCYIGQETIARLNTYRGVKQQLWGIRLNAPVEPGSPILSAGEKVGTLTSLLMTAEGPIGLGYIRTKAGGAGLSVTVAEAHGTVVDVPFLSRGYLAAGESPAAVD